MCGGLVGLWRMHQACLFCACTRDTWLECCCFLSFFCTIDEDEQLCNTETRIDVVQLDVSVVKSTEIRRKQHPELVALISSIAGATELLKLFADRLNEVRAQVARGYATRKGLRGTFDQHRDAYRGQAEIDFGA